MEEVWKEIEGYEGLYSVSNYGRVFSHITKKMLSTPKNRKKKYVNVVLHNKDGKKSVKVHRLVALAFVPNPNNFNVVNHKDENPANNMADNLEWCTREYNLNYGNARKKQALSHAKINEEETLKCIAMFESGYSLSDIAKSLGVTIGAVSFALKWKNKYNSFLESPVSNEKIKENGLRTMGEKHCKLSDADVLECIIRYRYGESVSNIANKKGVSRKTIYNILRGETAQARRCLYGNE